MSAYIVGFSFMIVGGCGPSEEGEPNEPEDYGCVVCTNSPDSDAAEWAGDAECSAYEATLNPVADCLFGEVNALQISFENCRRKPACVYEESSNE